MSLPVHKAASRAFITRSGRRAESARFPSTRLDVTRSSRGGRNLVPVTLAFALTTLLSRRSWPCRRHVGQLTDRYRGETHPTISGGLTRLRALGAGVHEVAGPGAEGRVARPTS